MIVGLAILNWNYNSISQ